MSTKIGGRRGRARVSVTALVLGAALTGAAGAATAQTPSPEDDAVASVDEVVVSARRRDERLQDVPVAVTALSEQTLQNLQAGDLGDIESAVPNLTLHVGDASNAVVYIRGVGQIDSLAFADPGVGVYVDDVYLGRAQGAFLDVYDVARIEVLRGPQGTLYGRNTIGGAVKFVSQPMTDEFEGRGEVTVGDYGRRDAKASVNVPLVPGKLVAKAALAMAKRDGYAENTVDGSDDGDKDLLAGRLAFEYRATDDLTFRLNFDASQDTPDTSRTPARATPVFGVPASTDPFKVEADFNDRNDLKTSGVSLVADWRVSDVLSLKSVTAYRRMDYDTKLDLDATAFGFFGVYDDEAQNQVSQEFQATYTGDRLTAVGGLYYFREHDLTYSGLYGPDIALVTGSLNDQTNTSYAVYGQGSYALTDALSLTAGLRYTWESKDFARTQKFFDASTPFPVDYGSPGLLVTDIDTSHDWSSLSPKLGVDYKVSDDVLAYVSVSRGFKSGGFDGRSNDADGARPYEPETMWAYEAGVKSVLFDHRLIANLAVFQNDYTDLQLSSFVADSGGGFAALFTNAGKATIRGAELELTARPVEPLTLNAVIGYLDARYDEYIGPGGLDISDQRTPVNAPKWSVRLGGTYRVELGEGSLVLGADVSRRSKTYSTVSSSEILAEDGYTLVDAFARYEAPGDRWFLSLGGKNLTDERYITHGFDLSDSLGYQLAYYGAPRTWSATLGVRF
ncbi:TonB-dependent receptor [Caulobacter sp. 17J65-9]|uniref:TonB-dependent receptor n=1 Tax=Caulobacter sp. 17J65-9 TaxID=2709382 RepID=UPI0013C96565|nr:TonB-dependent receptor [Caulobacter sp. 17J65-9]NEX94787.1 TonB-dependent receptor [Caulobacter sp. 17J65-9]